jgi:hypothetical protein
MSRTSDGHINCFFANFSGLRAGSNPIQTPQVGTVVTVRSNSDGKGFFLPFLGDVQEVKGIRRDHSMTFFLPPITKGAVFWYENK